MSLGEADAKFPGQSSGLPPPPSAENPGQVYPKSDPTQAPAQESSQPTTITTTSFFGNPFLLNDALDKVDKAFVDVMDIVAKEAMANGRSVDENSLFCQFKDWRSRLVQLREWKEEPCSGSPAGGVFED